MKHPHRREPSPSWAQGAGKSTLFESLLRTTGAEEARLQEDTGPPGSGA